jgi:hypothetical protein
MTHSQSCDCKEQILFVINYIETNNPAYQKLKGNKKEHAQYLKTKVNLIEKSNMIKDTLVCLNQLSDYLTLIKDHHTSIYLTPSDAKNKTENAHENKSNYEFMQLSDQLNYVRVSSFSGYLKKELDVFYDTIAQRLMSKPFMVLDLRDNAGGNDNCYYALMNYLYTKPIKVDDCDVWVSEENLRLYNKMFHTNTTLLEKMNKAKLNSFVPISQNQTWKIDNPSRYPCKVFILQNRSIGSSAEDLIQYAKQSNKVITLGDNTGGYMGFGNVISVRTPKNIFQLQSTTTKYKNGSQFEYVGIPPDIRLPNFERWQDTVMTLITKEKKCR